MQSVVDQNNAILLAQQQVNEADAETFNSGAISNTIQRAQEDLKQIPPRATLHRLGKTSRITIKAAVAAADTDDAFHDLDLTSLFTFHLKPNDTTDSSSFLSRLALAESEDTQKILVKTKSAITGYQPEKYPMPCLYEIKTTEVVKVKGKKVTKTVTKRCTKFACTGIPVCAKHINMMAKLSKHDRFTPGKI